MPSERHRPGPTILGRGGVNDGAFILFPQRDARSKGATASFLIISSAATAANDFLLSERSPDHHAADRGALLSGLLGDLERGAAVGLTSFPARRHGSRSMQADGSGMGCRILRGRKRLSFFVRSDSLPEWGTAL